VSEPTGRTGQDGDRPSDERPSDEQGRSLASTAAQAEVIGVRQGMFGAPDAGDTSGYGGLVRTVAMPAPAIRPFGPGFDEIADALAAGLAGDADGVGHSDADPDDTDDTDDTDTVADGAHSDARAAFDTAVERVVIDRGELTLQVRREHLLAVVRVLRDEPDLRFELLSGVSGAHYPDEAGRELHALYHLLSITNNQRLRLEVTCPDADPHLPSVVEVYPTADWHERETWDFFGIQFDGHPALTRIQLPDDWPGHPQRKDYPLGGIPVEYKGATIAPPDTRRAYS
jgi:NADH-quinone oxidoreductase subunit C